MPKYQITGPDGATYEVDAPEGATEQDVMGFVQSQIGGQQSRADPGYPPVPPGETVYTEGRTLKTPAEEEAFYREQEAKRRAAQFGSFNQALTPAGQGTSFGAMDEAIGAMAAPVTALMSGNSIPDEYAINRDAMRMAFEKERSQHPIRSIATEIGAALPLSAATGGGAATQAGSLGGRALATGAVGGAQAGVYGFNSGEDGFSNRLKNAAVPTALGFGMGAAAPYAGNAIRQAGRRAAQTSVARDFAKKVPDTAALRKMGDDLFKRAEQAGVVIKPDAVKQNVDDIAAYAAKEGIDPTLHPGATAALKRMAEVADQPLTLEKAQILRRVLGSAAKSTSPDERRIASGMIDKLDEFIGGLKPEQVQSGSLGTAADDLVNARDIWSRMRKSEMIDNAFTKADLQASGVENGLRIQFRQILNNPRLRRGLSPDEVAAMERVVKGDITSNTLRRLGRLSGGAGQQHNMLNAMLGSGAGAGVGGAVGGPPGAIAGATIVPAMGWGAQKGAEALTTRNARLAQALIASGMASDVPVNPQSGRLVEQLLRYSAPMGAPVMQNVR